MTVTGLMRPPQDRNFFTPADDPAHGLYFTRDPAAIAAHFGLARAAPFVIDQDKIAIPGGWPEGGATIGNIPNNHMEYALTWFGGALGLWIVFGTYLFRVWRAGRKSGGQRSLKPNHRRPTGRAGKSPRRCGFVLNQPEIDQKPRH